MGVPSSLKTLRVNFFLSAFGRAMIRFPSLLVKIRPEGVKIFSLMLSSILPDRIMPMPVSLFIFKALSGVSSRLSFAVLVSSINLFSDVEIDTLRENVEESLTGFMAAVNKYLPPGLT